MGTIPKTELETQYQSGKSMWEISRQFNCSVHKVVYWMDKYKIPRRSRSDAMYEKLNPQGDPFNIKASFTKDDILLLGLGLGIYWGEGNKVTPQSSRVTNTDPNMLKVFIRFLRNICGVKMEKMGFSLICFNDSDKNEVVKFWSKELDIPSEKFGKITQIPPQGKGNYKRKSQFGVCTISVGNIKLKKWITSQIEQLPARMAQW